jgi:phenylpropionate dioxygenase-like ring-hydroxylating dioxygenase large terminal subunit
MALETQLDESAPLRVMRRTWQPVALSQELPPNGISSFQLLDQEIVLARVDNRVLAADIACPHKGMRLSLGRVCDAQLQCPYHGWRFGADGQCAHIPSLPDASISKLSTSSLRTYSVQERYGLIWVQLEEDALQVIPEVPEFESDWTFLIGPPTLFQSGWRREVENFLDMTHFAFAHSSTLGQAANTRLQEMQIETVNGGFTMKTQFPSLRTLHQSPGKLSSAHDRFYRTFLPNVTVIRQSWPDGDERLLLHIPVPNTNESCTVFWALAISPGFVGPKPESQLEFAIQVLAEDRQMCENQIPREVPINPSRGGWGVLVAPGDTLANTFERELRKWLLSRL